MFNQHFSENLKKKLEYYIERFNGKVRLIRNSEREGLIRTRSKGALNARGEIILFLDAHCEVGYNWLPPLIAPIARDRCYFISQTKFTC
jgi:polypeptide N-acetylgalactosaminyltransferase